MSVPAGPWRAPQCGDWIEVEAEMMAWVGDNLTSDRGNKAFRRSTLRECEEIVPVPLSTESDPHFVTVTVTVCPEV